MKNFEILRFAGWGDFIDRKGNLKIAQSSKSAFIFFLISF